MSNYLEFSAEDYEKHNCESRREGEWIIFECPHCNYVREWNLTTNEMKVTKGEDESVMHSGMFQPVGLQMETINPN